MESAAGKGRVAAVQRVSHFPIEFPANDGECGMAYEPTQVAPVTSW